MSMMQLHQVIIYFKLRCAGGVHLLLSLIKGEGVVGYFLTRKLFKVQQSFDMNGVNLTPESNT